MSAEPHPGPRAPWHDLGDAVRVLAPPEPPSRFAAFLDRTLETGAEPFAESRLDTLGRLSSAFLADPVLRQDAASVAVAFWLRRAQLARLKADFEQAGKANPTVVRVPVGRVFHIAPSNVDTLFVYSWALSYLCGNANVVRVSQDLGPIVLAMLDVFSRAQFRRCRAARPQPLRDLRARRGRDRGDLGLVQPSRDLGRRRNGGGAAPAAAQPARQRARVRQQVLVRRAGRRPLPRRRSDRARAGRGQVLQRSVLVRPDGMLVAAGRVLGRRRRLGRARRRGVRDRGCRPRSRAAASRRRRRTPCTAAPTPSTSPPSPTCA